MEKVIKKTGIALLCLIGVIASILVAMLIRQEVVDKRINNDFSSIYEDENLQAPVSVSGIELITQEVSCGYAVIETLAKWQGMAVTEADLLEQNNGEITTAMGDGFMNEMNKQFPYYNTVKHKNLTNSELLYMIYESLERGIPVPFEFAALYSDGDTSAWTLHFAVVTAMDVHNNSITVSNPYGYEESYAIEDFLKATRYESYENMVFYLRLGFASGIFSKNTIYIIE